MAGIVKKILIRGSRVIKCQKSVFLTFSLKRYYDSFYFLHDNRDQHCATSGLGVWFQKIFQGFAGD